MTARWGASIIVLLAFLGAFSGLWMGKAGHSPLAQAGGGTSSGSSGSGSSGSGSSGDGSSGDGSSGSGSSGDGTSGDGSSGDGTSGSSGDGSSGSSGSGTGTDSPTGTSPPRGGTPSTAPSRATPTTTPPRSPGTTRRSGIPQPTTTAPIRPDRVRDGRPTECRSDATPGTACFTVGAGGRIDAVRVPDGAGGFVVLPVADAPVFGDSGSDTGSSETNVTNNVDVQVDVNLQTGEVLRLERQADKVTQAVFGTLAALLLVLIASASGAVGFRRYGRRP